MLQVNLVLHNLLGWQLALVHLYIIDIGQLLKLSILNSHINLNHKSCGYLELLCMVGNLYRYHRIVSIELNYIFPFEQKLILDRLFQLLELEAGRLLETTSSNPRIKAKPVYSS